MIMNVSVEQCPGIMLSNGAAKKTWRMLVPVMNKKCNCRYNVTLRCVRVTIVAVVK